jgi:hypothetical protein
VTVIVENPSVICGEVKVEMPLEKVTETGREKENGRETETLCLLCLENHQEMYQEKEVETEIGTVILALLREIVRHRPRSRRLSGVPRVSAQRAVGLAAAEPLLVAGNSGGAIEQ